MLDRVRANRYLAALLAVGAGALGIPALATAGGSGGAPMTSAPTGRPGNVPVSATSGGIMLVANASAFVRSGLSVSGTVPAGAAGDAVEIDQLSSAPASGWLPVAVARAAPDGSFAAAWSAGRAGPVTIRAVLQGRQASSAAASPPAISVTVYRRSIATLYGPGFWGQRTACGVILRRRTIGVANRTLKCGTEVQIYYKGRVITAPVIDRGPYAHRANWDLTMATGRALGMRGTAVIGAASSTSTSATPATGAAGPPAAQ